MNLTMNKTLYTAIQATEVENFSQLDILPYSENIFYGLSAPERLKIIFNVLSAPYPDNFFWILIHYNALSPWFTELIGSSTKPAGPTQYHSGSIFEHISLCMRKVTGNALAVWMALCHDLGKCATCNELLPRHHGHEQTGIQMAKAMGLRLGLPQNFIDAGAIASKYHMKAGRYSILRPGTKRDMLIEIQEKKVIDEFFKVVEADTGKKILHLAQNDLNLINKINKNDITEAQFRDAQCREISSIR